MKICQNNSRSGFSIIEIAIVLVVIGLVVARVFTAQEIVRQASIRNQIKQIESYRAAIPMFYEKYRGLPGDLTRAQAYGISGIACQTTAVSNFYDGNGSNILEDVNAAHVRYTGEIQNFWIHLSNSFLIKDPIKTCSAPKLANQDYPRAELGNSIIALSNISDKRLYFVLGGLPGIYSYPSATISVNPEGSDGNLAGNYLNPEDAQELDYKIDDQNPKLGLVKVITGYLQDYLPTNTNPSNAGSLVYDSVDNSTNCIYNGVYNVSYDRNSCTLSILAK